MTHNAKKTKVLFVITKSNFGGAQHYVYDLATTLPSERFEGVVALGGQGLLVDKLHSAGIRTIPLNSLERDMNPLRDMTSFFALWNIFRAERPDIVHLNSAKASGLGTIAAHLARVPNIIFTAHGWAFNEDRSKLSRIVIKFFSWITVVLSHKTIAVSAAVKKDTASWPFVSKKISVIKNGVKDLDFFTREGARAKLFTRMGVTLPPSAFIVGTVAELHKSKSISYAIEAFAKLAPQNQNLYYLILGNGEEKEHLHALIELYKLQGRVFLLGFVEDAARFLRAFDTFVLPSSTEALGFVLLEAGLAKLPVIATTVGGIPEVIEDKKTGILVPARHADALAEALNQLIISPTLCNTLSVSLHKKILHDFSLDRMTTDTIVLYKNR